MTQTGETNVIVARRAWGDAAPEWVIALAVECDTSTQAALAKRLGYTAAVINATLRNRYAGRLDRVEQRVRGELMREHVECPVLGQITRRKCMDEQSRPYVASNRLRIELRRACPRCPNRMGDKA